MPIKYQVASSIASVERELHVFELQYNISSADFAAHPSIEDVVSEFDAIEWSFLLMQKRALEDDGRSPTLLFSSSSMTRTSPVELSGLYEKVAA